MLTFYLIALIIGGTLVLASLLFGGDSDADADVDVGHVDVDASVGVDADVDVDADVGADVHAGGVDFSTWLPLVSLRFWTFFAAFFGLTGTALTFADPGLGRIATGVIAAGVGYASGLGVMAAFRYMRKSQTSIAVRRDDYIGAGATVMLRVAKGQLGKVRMELKGRTVEALATTEDERPFAVKEKALVYAVNDDGHVVLTRAGEK